MRIVINKTTPADQEYWHFIEQRAREFKALPSWMRLESQPPRLNAKVTESEPDQIPDSDALLVEKPVQ